MIFDSSQSHADRTAARLSATPGMRRIPSRTLEQYMLPDFLSADDCAALITMIEVQHRPSTITDDNGCATTTNVTITEPCTLLANITGPTTNCPTGVAALNAVATGLSGNPTLTYSWSNSATTSAITVGPASNTTYTVTVTDTNYGSGCTATASSLVESLNVICQTNKVQVCTAGTWECVAESAVHTKLCMGATLGDCTLAPCVPYQPVCFGNNPGADMIQVPHDNDLLDKERNVTPPR